MRRIYKIKQIKLKINDNEKHDSIIKFQLTTIQMDWSILREEFGKHIIKGLSDDDKFNLIIKRLKNTGLFTKECDFWTVYNEIKDKYNLPSNFQEEYKDKFKESSWFQLLNIDNDYYKTIKEIKQSLKHLKKIDKNLYKKETKKNANLPPYPEYLIHNFWTEMNVKENVNICI